MERYEEIGINNLAIKARSKKEVYSLLVTEGGIYLPPLADSNYKYISQVIVGEKKHLKSKDVTVWHVPQILGLKISQLLEFARSRVDIDSYLPDYDYKKEPNRQWVCNVINSLINKDFQELINLKIKERVKHVVMMKKLNVKALPEFINIFKASQNISTVNGRSHFLIKRAGKRKWEDVMKDDKEQLKDEIKLNERLKGEIEGLKDRIEYFRQREYELLKENELLHELSKDTRQPNEDKMS